MTVSPTHTGDSTSTAVNDRKARVGFTNACIMQEVVVEQSWIKKESTERLGAKSKMQPHPGTMDKSEQEKMPPGTQFKRLGKGSQQKQAHNHNWKADWLSPTGEHRHIR
jgi:hypothetical protein